MYENLVKRPRFKAGVEDFPDSIWDEAADAIEKLQKAVNFHKFNSEFWEGKYNSLADEKWIPVEEALPEENGRYLVRYKRDIVIDYTEFHDDEVRIMRFFVDDGWRYPFLCQPELRKAEQQTVTHWMVLPNLPAEENANGE